MSSRLDLVRRILAAIWEIFAFGIIVLAVLVAVARLLAPGIGQFREDILAWVNARFPQAVAAGRVSAEIRGLSPQLAFEDVRVLDADGRTEVLKLESVTVEIDPWRSLLERRLIPSRIALTGSRFTIVRKADGSVALPGLAAGGGNRREGAARKFWSWVLSQRKLSMESFSVRYVTEGDEGRVTELQNASLVIRNVGKRHQVDGRVALPEELGHMLSFAFDFQGSGVDPLGWDGEVYFNASDLQLSPWLPKKILAGAQVVDGAVNFSAWGSWRERRIQSLEGDFSIHHLRIAVAGKGSGPAAQPATATSDSNPPTPPGMVQINAVAGRVGWQRDAQGWSLGIDRFVVMPESEMWLPSRVDATLTRLDSATMLEIGVSALRIEDTLRIARSAGLIEPSAEESLDALAPTADLYGTLLRYVYAKNAPREFLFSTHVHNFAVLPWRRIPEVSGLDGWVIFDGHSGAVEFNSLDAQLRLPAAYDQPLPEKSITGQLRWTQDEQAWHVVGRDLQIANDDVTLRGDLDLAVPRNGGSPFLFLLADVAGGQVASTGRYLPTRKMPPPVARWLETSLRAGEISTARALVHGRLNEFPFDGGKGRFTVTADLSDVQLDYASGWPAVEGLAGELVFDGRRMTLAAQRARILGAAVRPTRARIPNLAAKRPVLYVDGRVTGPAAAGLRFLAESPLHTLFGDYIEDVDAAGNVEVELKLTRPFFDPQAQQVAGKVRLLGVNLNIAHGLADVSALQGILQFTQDGLTANDLTGRAMGQPASGAVQTVQLPSGSAVVVTADGASSADELRQLQNYPQLTELEPVLAGARGKTRWTATLTLPQRIAGAAEAAGRLRVEAPLEGLEIQLPPPLGKTLDATRPLALDIPLPGAPDRPVHVAYGADTRAVFAPSAAEGKDLEIERAELRFGGAPAELPQSPGLRIAGALKQFSWTQWQDFVEQLPDSNEPSLVDMINALDVEIGELEAYRRPFHDVRLTASRGVKTWRAKVQSREIAGDIVLPDELDRPLEMDLDYVRLPADSLSQEEQPPDPRTWPPLKIVSRELVIGGAHYGSLDTVVQRRGTGLHLEHLELASSHTRLSGRGDWIAVGNDQTSSFHIQLNTTDLGKAMSLFGYAGSVEGGACGCEFIVYWPGPPTSFPIDRMGGILRFDIKNGRFVEIEPGAGRLFGLFNMHAISRRLVLDFSDFFKKGFTFDSLRGEFTLEEGDAYTEGVLIKGPAADIALKGRVGIAARDYDQVVVVVPHVGSALPVAGALTGGVGAGVAIFFVQKLLGSPLEEIARYEYKVSGSWDNPKIERVVRPPANGETTHDSDAD